MVLVIDIGNSNVVACAYCIDDDKNYSWKELMRVKTDCSKQYFDWFLDANYFLSEYSDKVSLVLVSSVVPKLNDTFTKISFELFSQKAVFIDYKLYEKLPIKVIQPRIIGADIVANALAGYSRYPNGCIIADFGTVLTFTTVFDNEIQGVSFVPGLNTAFKSLSDKTAQLPLIRMNKPVSVIGKNTSDAINGGIVFGYAGLVDRIIEQIYLETNRKLPLLSTGGLGDAILQYCKSEFDYYLHLTVDGIRLIAEYNT
ncbi:type III pantothenate kinase [Bacteroidales bacterium OttesenSCG-928-K03]|nr:type III pantothenate kinase [Bacteroidales bacterium OttesenSCG-928-K03]